MRTAPGSSVSAAAYAAAAAQAAHLGTKGGTWQALTDKPFLNDPVPGYRDPNWSDFGSGYGLVTGRISALTAAGGAIFAGGADGGVWKSAHGNGHWKFWSTGLPRLSIGALATDPADGSVWVGLGEANTAFENFNALRRLPARRRRPRVAPRRRERAREPQHLPHPLRRLRPRLRGDELGPLPAQRGGRRAVAPGAEARPEPDELALPDVADHGRDVPAGHRRTRRPGGARLARWHASVRPRVQRLLRLERLGQGGHVPPHHADRRDPGKRHRPDELRRRRRAHLRGHRIAVQAREPERVRRVHEPAGRLRLEERQPGGARGRLSRTPPSWRIRARRSRPSASSPARRPGTTSTSRSTRATRCTCTWGSRRYTSRPTAVRRGRRSPRTSTRCCRASTAARPTARRPRTPTSTPC